MSKEKLSRGQASYRREILARARQTTPPDLIEQRIADQQQAKKRFEEVKRLLMTEDNLTPPEKISLRVEKIWLAFRLGRIPQSERQSRLQRMLNDLEKENPDLFQWLTEEDDQGLTLLARIRDKVLPPQRIGGYYTKRKR